MNPKRIENYVNRLKSISEGAQKPFTEGERSTITIVYDGKGFNLVDECVDDLVDLIETLYIKDNWSAKFSKKYIRDRLKKIVWFSVTSDHEDEEIVAVNFIKLVSAFEEMIDPCIVHFPLFGIRLSSSEFKLGKISIKPFTPSSADHLYDYIKNITEKSPHKEEEKAEILGMFRRQIGKFVNLVMAEFQVVAEPSRATEIARDEIYRAIDLLRFSIPTLYSLEVRPKIGILGEISIGSTESFVISPNKNGFEWTKEMPKPPLEINDTNVKRMKEIGFFEASSILTKESSSISDFESTILQGIHWFADSIAQSREENKVTSLTTCLEVLFTKQKDAPIAQNIAEGVALILSKDPKNRENLDKRTKELYNKRSRISHGGETVVKDEDLGDLIDICGSLLVYMINKHNDFKTKQEFHDYLKKVKYSAPEA
jgi:hypothetical protein